MFCPKCGNPDQSPESFCRQCGTFLPDLDKQIKKGQTPEENVNINLIMSSLTIITCLILTILLYVFLGFRENTHPLIYVTTGFLIAMTAWHFQTLWRSVELKKQIKELKPERKDIDNREPVKGLPSPSFTDQMPVTVTENTTRDLSQKRPRSSQTQ